MTLFIIVAVLVAEHFLLPWQHLRQAGLIERWLELHQSLPIPPGLREGFAGMVGLLLPPLLAVAFLHAALDGLLGGVLGGVFAGLVLLYSLGPRDLNQEVQELDAAIASEDAVRIRDAAVPFLGAAEEIQSDADHALVAGILVASLRRIFGVLIGFILLGPAGALAYRLVCELRCLARDLAYPGLQGGLERLMGWLDWLPARGLIGLFALAGNFETTLQAWRRCDPSTRPDPAAALVACAGAGALQLDTGVVASPLRRWEGHDSPAQATMALVWRSIVMLLGLLALGTVAYWLP